MRQVSGTLLRGAEQFFSIARRSVDFGQPEVAQKTLPPNREDTPILVGFLDRVWGRLFFGGSRTGYDSFEVMRVLMKRLHQNYSEIKKMPLNLRDYLFRCELDEIEEENRKAGEK